MKYLISLLIFIAVVKVASVLPVNQLYASSQPERITASVEEIDNSGDTPLYGTFESVLNAQGVAGNKFTKFASFKFTKGVRSFSVDGFHDGGDIWRARFMPGEQGTWKYEWSFNGAKGSDTFECTTNTNTKNHGHIKIDPDFPQYLICDDGSPHYAWGGGWFHGKNYGPETKKDQTNNWWLSDADMSGYLDLIAANNHNASYMKVTYFPVENDKLSWDLDWIHRGEWLVREMGKRGIYCQINYFCTWARDAQNYYDQNTKGSGQLMNAWTDSDNFEKENYIRNIVARFSAYYNVYWELGNEILIDIADDLKPGDAGVFVEQANTKYIPWIRKYDVYDLPIGCSFTAFKNRPEGYGTAQINVGLVQSMEVDLLFVHWEDELNAWKHLNKPMILNEPCQMNNRGDHWQDKIMRNSTYAPDYRDYFWMMFVNGGAGCYHASWYKKNVPPNDAALKVIDFQNYLRSFMEALPVPYNEMMLADQFIVSGPKAHGTRALEGKCYVTYWKDGPQDEGKLKVKSPLGKYTVKWFNPTNGKYIKSEEVASNGDSVTIAHPAWETDVALLITILEE
jgi:hypothetical protein